MYEQKRTKNSLSRLLLIIITLIILITVMYFGYFKVKEGPEKQQDTPKPTISLIVRGDANLG